MQRILLSVIALLITAYVPIVHAETAAPTPTATATQEEPTLPSKEAILSVKKDDIVMGSESAPVTIIEYASLSCTHCASFYTNSFDDLKKKYIDTGKVRFVYRDFPLNLPALHAAMMIQCAPKERAEKFIKVTFSTQNNWAPKKDYLEILSNISKLGGMTGKEFDTCIANKELEDKITQERFEASKVLDVRATPSFFINGIAYTGAHNLEGISAVIDPLLNALTSPASPTSDTPSGQKPAPSAK